MTIVTPQKNRSLLRRIIGKIRRLVTPTPPPRPKYPGEEHRIDYQKQLVDFKIQPGDRVVDVGCGTDTFPFATHLVDLYMEATHHRHDAIQDEVVRSDGRPFLLADILDLPFEDKSFDFVYCSHVLEHVDNPILACQELTRIGKRGYIETPTLGKDGLFAWAQGMHRWHLVSIANTLCFFEYDQRQLEGIRSLAFREIVFGPDVHPLQKAFFDNLDFFNVMFLWEESFRVYVFWLNGKVESCDDTRVKSPPESC